VWINQGRILFQNGIHHGRVFSAKVYQRSYAFRSENTAKELGPAQEEEEASSREELFQ